MVLTLDAVARPTWFRPRLIDLYFTVTLAGAPLVTVNFRGTAAFGIGGTRGREVEVGVVRWQDLARASTTTHRPDRSLPPSLHPSANLDTVNTVTTLTIV